MRAIELDGQGGSKGGDWGGGGGGGGEREERRRREGGRVRRGAMSYIMHKGSYSHSQLFQSRDQ